ncbi:MAG: uracil-DNA glycosylase family protein, partial [Candidatus Thorarchaeota archaeon]
MRRRKKTFISPRAGTDCIKYVIVGEQPGRREIVLGKPFVGPAGEELDDSLRNAKLVKSEGYFTNVIKDLDKPLEHYIEFTRKGPVVYPEGQDYINLLAKELNAIKPDVVIWSLLWVMLLCLP